MPSTVIGSLPGGLDAIVGRALAIDPADRFPSARVFADALETWNREHRRRGKESVVGATTRLAAQVASATSRRLQPSLTAAVAGASAGAVAGAGAGAAAPAKRGRGLPRAETASVQATARPNPSASPPVARGRTRRRAAPKKAPAASPVAAAAAAAAAGALPAAAPPPTAPPPTARRARELGPAGRTPPPVVAEEAEEPPRRRAAVLLSALALALLIGTVVAMLLGNGGAQQGGAAGPSATTASPLPTQPVVPAAPSPLPTASPTLVPSPTPGPTATPTPTAPPTPRPTPRPTPTPPPAISPAAAAVVAFYDAVEAHDWDTAIDLWSPSMQQRYPPDAWLIGRFRRTTRIDITSLRTLSIDRDAGTARVAVTLVEYRTVEPSPRTFVGAWDLVRIDGRWVLNDPDF